MVIFPSLWFWYSLLLLLLSLDILGLLYLLQFGLWLCLSLPFCIRFFLTLRLGLVLAVLFRVFPHAVATAGFFQSSFVFLPATVTAVPSCLPQIFSLLRLWLLIPVFLPVWYILRLRLLLRFDAPHVVFCVAGSPFAVPKLSGCCFPCASARFLSQGFHRLFILSLLWSSGCILSHGVCSSSCLSVVFFAPALVLPPPVCLAMFTVAFWFSGASDSFGSPVTVAKWSPFWTSQGCYGLCLLCSKCQPVMISFLFLSPLCSSVSFASGVLFVTC